MGRGSWQATAQGVAKSWTRLSTWHRLYCVCLSHSSVCYNQMYVCAEYLWTFMGWTGGPGVLWFMGSQRVGHNWETELTDWVGSQLPKVTWGHSCASRAQVQELEVSVAILHHICKLCCAPPEPVWGGL